VTRLTRSPTRTQSRIQSPGARRQRAGGDHGDGPPRRTQHRPPSLRSCHRPLRSKQRQSIRAKNHPATVDLTAAGLTSVTSCSMLFGTHHVIELPLRERHAIPRRQSIPAPRVHRPDLIPLHQPHPDRDRALAPLASAIWRGPGQASRLHASPTRRPAISRTSSLASACIREAEPHSQHPAPRIGGHAVH